MNVLFVDDDTKLLTSLKRVFMGQNVFMAHFAEGGEKALEIMGDTAFELVVADMRMPGMSGATLLRIIRERRPQTVRFVLSGHSDQDMVISSVRNAHRFLSKPCPFDEIMEAIREVHDIIERYQNPEIRRVAGHVDALPVLPATFERLTRGIEQSEAIEHIGDIVSRDVGLTAAILKIVNSTFFGKAHARDPVQAVTYLGRELLANLVLKQNIFKEFDVGRFEGFSLDKLWEHGLNVGHCCRSLCRETHLDIPEEDCFTTGLLHDVGKIIIADSLPKQFREILNLASSTDMSVSEAEAQILGFTHADLGAYLLCIWGYPQDMVWAVARHHDPIRQEGDNRLLSMLHAANGLEHEINIMNKNYNYTRLNHEFLSSTGVDQESLEQWKDICAATLASQTSRE